MSPRTHGRLAPLRGSRTGTGGTACERPPWATQVARMQCPRCRSENREEARFCRECGATFSALCPNCGVKVEAGSRFCDACGAPLIATRSSEARPSRFPSPESYTPKHLTEKILSSKAALEGER